MQNQLLQAHAKLNQFRQLLNGGNGTLEPARQQPQGAEADRSTPATSTTTIPASTSNFDRTTSTGKSRAKNRALSIFETIQRWNQLHPDDTWAITVGLLEQGFGINRKAAKEFVQEHQHAIDLHHQTIGVSNERGHNRGKEASELRRWVEQTAVSPT